MAEPTDELPDVSPDEKRTNHDELDSILNSGTETKSASLESGSEEPGTSTDYDTSAEIELSPEEELNPEEPMQRPDSETVDTIPYTEADTLSPTDDENQASNADSAGEDQFMTSDGQDPIDISMQIAQGTGADSGSYLDEDNLLQQVAGVFLLWWHWAYFEITVTSPNLPIYDPPKSIHPQLVAGTQEYEFVYDICDFGYKLSTSKGQDMYSVGMSMCKLFYTIEKMIYILIKRIKDEGIGTETEVQVTFDGHLLAQRKAFESIINLNYNVVVTNFDPGTWGERYLDIVKRLSDRGYGYPSEAPREIYKITKHNVTPTKY